ncbi:MAG: hypothetical protein V1489_02250 [Candidatus Liptonbacteria bacterium]
MVDESAAGKVKKLVRWHIGAMTAVIAVGVLLILFYNPKPSRAPELGTRPLAQGRQEYTVEQPNRDPQITKVVIDPFDPAIGGKQSLEVTASSSEPLSGVLVVMHADNGSKEVQLQNKSASGGKVYYSEYEITDTHLKQYSASVTVYTKNSSTSATLTFR